MWKLSAKIYIGLGANLGNPRDIFSQAISMMSEFCCIDAVSKLYASKPYGFDAQPDFFNAVARASTEIDPHELLAKLREIELKLGKKIIRKNGPRIIDLDILIYNELTIESSNLTIPHPGILTRDFVILPLLELNPEFDHPSWDNSLQITSQNLDKTFVFGEPLEWKYSK